MNKNKLMLGGMAVSALMLAACGSDSSKTPSAGGGSKAFQEIALDTGTTAGPKWAYFDIDTGKVVEKSGEWDIAVKRDKGFKLNKGYKAALAEAQADYYNADGTPIDSAFTNADAQFELDTFYATTTVDKKSYAAPYESSAFGSNWYTYNFGTHALTANADKYFIVAAGDGSYAKVRASNITPEYVATFEFYIQKKDGKKAFSDTAVSVDVALKETAQTCVDFATATSTNKTIECTDASWDVKFDIANRSYTVRTNGGLSGSGKATSYGPVAVDDFKTGTDTGLGYSLKADYLASAFTDSNPWAYGIGGGHTMLPNYRVYAINFGDKRDAVKVQFVDYYDQDKNPGKITMRYMSLSDNGE